MATVYSLVCWGGLTGKVVSISASTDVVTLTNHGLRNGAKLWPSGTLPSELNASTPVYARSTGTNTFTLHTSAAGAIANTGQILFAGSSTYAAVTLKSDLVASPSTALADYGLSDLSRWGAPGSERVYDGVASWRTTRNAATNATLDEVCEIAESFIEYRGSTLNINLGGGSNLIHTKIGSKRTPAFHAGVFDIGYELRASSSYVNLQLTGLNSIVDGFEVSSSNTDNTLLEITGTVIAKNILVDGAGTARTHGIRVGSYARAENVVVKNCITGVICVEYATNYFILNCLITKCTTGFQKASSSSTAGFFYNNIALGNTTNWQSSPTGISAASKNAGGTGEAWVSASGTRIEITEASPFSTTFTDWTNNVFRLASGSALIDAATEYYNIQAADVSGAERPSYNNGGAEYYDVGPYEFDKGFGPHPASHTLTLTNVVVGSRVHIRDQADTVTHYDAIAAASSVVIPITVYGDSRDNWRIKVRKASAAPYYQPWETIMTATAGASSIYVSQIPD